MIDTLAVTTYQESRRKVHKKRGEKMVIKLEVLRETPHAIADAIIDYRMAFVQDEVSLDTAREDIRLIGAALTGFAEACDRLRND